MGSPPAKISKYPCFGSSFSKASFFEKIDLFRKFISENIISEVHFRKHYFGSALPKYCDFCRFIKTLPLPQSFTLNQNKKWQRRKFVQTEFQNCIKAPITLLNNI